MERLTGRFKDGGAFILPSVVSQLSPMKSEIIEKLADYEDAEEQGLLKRFPCLIGTTVYKLEPTIGKPKKYIETIVTRYEIYENEIWFCFANGLGRNIKDFGQYVFLTREEAEQALADMGV